ncbi:hypothetical protein PMAYCL1PPCAC_16563, partial [Pristionchus mayeri]
MPVQIRFITETLAAPEYNCSAHTSQEWTKLYGTPQRLLGSWSIAFATVCQIMHFLALADMCGLTATGTFFGYVAFNGMVFCSDVFLGALMGAGAYCFWSVSTCTCAILVINRICELTERATYFQGWRSTTCLLLGLVYSVVGTLFTRPVFPNSTHQTMGFDPYIPGHTPDEYPNIANMVHNFCVAFFVPNLYLVLCSIVRKNSTRFQDSTTTQALQAKIFTQASIICCGNVGTAAAWLIQMFVPTPQFVITAGMITVQCMHGLPCFIYLALNKSVREELWKMLGKMSNAAGAPQAFTSVNSRTVSSVIP